MQKQKNKSPEIRFKQYTDAWEQRRLGSILNYEQPTKYIVSSTDYDDSFSIPVLTAGQSFILGYTNETNGIKEANENNPVIIFDDFTTSSHYVDFPFKVKSSAMKLLDLKGEDNEIYFIYNALKNIKYIPRNHERHWISIFSDFEVMLPKFEEQKKIGMFLKSFDNLITLHQRKLEILKNSKKSLQQKMFPKKGENVPEIRFPGFTGAWEQRKLGDELDINSGRDYKHLDKGDIPVYGTGGYMLSVNESLSERDAVGIGRKGTIDKPQLLKAPFWTVDTLFYMTSKDNNNLLFYFSLLDNIRWKKYDESTGVPSLSKATISKVNIRKPILKEQEKIGIFFKQLDNLITLHQRKLETLKEYKKTMLQKMFI